MKNVLIVILLNLFFYINGCAKERKFVYPKDERLEINRICQYIEIRNTNRFMVLLGKIYPLNKDGITIPLQNIHTSLDDAGYFCGKQYSINYNCYNFKSKNIFKDDCKY